MGLLYVLTKWGPALQVDEATTKSSLLILGYHPRFMYWNSYSGTAITWWATSMTVSTCVRLTSDAMPIQSGFPIQTQPAWITSRFHRTSALLPPPWTPKRLLCGPSAPFFEHETSCPQVSESCPLGSELFSPIPPACFSFWHSLVAYQKSS